MSESRFVLAAVALLTPAPAALARDFPRNSEPLAAPVRCVGDYLEAIAAAAPPRPRRAPPPATSHGTELRWGRARAYLAPRAAAKLDVADRPQPLAPWSTLGRDGAFLGYELLAVRRAPRGAVVVVSRERTEHTLGAAPSLATCGYLVAKVGGVWRIADKRCGEDFSDDEVVSNYQGYWDEPAPRDARQPAGESFGEDIE